MKIRYKTCEISDFVCIRQREKKIQGGRVEREKGKHWKLIIPGIILALVLLIAAVFHVNEITVEGNTFFSQEVVAGEVCNTFLDHNVVSSWIKRKLGFCPSLPYVREYQVTYPGIHKIHIKLYEKKMIAGISYMNQFIYFDKDGRCTEKYTG